MDVKATSGEASSGNEEYVIGHWMKSDIFNRVAKNDCVPVFCAKYNLQEMNLDI